MLKLNHHVLAAFVVAAAHIYGGSLVSASHQFSLFGNTEIVPGPDSHHFALLMVSDAAAEEPYAVVAYTPGHYKEFGDLKKLTATYQILDGGFGGGSMRFAIGLDTDGDGELDGHVSVYFGTPPSFNDPPTGEWEESGNFIGLPDDELRFDTSQVGGTFYDNYSNALALIGDAEVLYVDLVVDAYWAVPGGVQSVLVSEVKINHHSYRPKEAN